MTDEQTIRAALDAEIARLTRRCDLLLAMRTTGVIPIASLSMVMELVNTSKFQSAVQPAAEASGGFEAAPPDVASSSLSPSGLDASLSPESVAMTAADTSAPGALPGACGAEVPLQESAGASPPGEPQGPPPVQMVAPLLSERASDESKHPEDMTIAEQAAWCFINGHGLEVNPWSESDPRYVTWIKCYRREKRKAEKTVKSAKERVG